MKNWYVVNTHPHQEERANLNLRRQGYESWLPKLRRQRRHARRVDTSLTSLFPGYIFVNLDCGMQPWRTIDSTFGVRRILCQGERPWPVERGFVEDLKKAADERGVVGLPAENLKIGQPLRLLTGPFADRIGTLLQLSEGNRVAVLLELLGREVHVVVAREQVTAVA